MTHTDHKSKKKSGKTADGRVRQFLVVHKRWLSFIGAVVVFATFVLKEGLRDNLKDLVGALENAQNAILRCHLELLRSGVKHEHVKTDLLRHCYDLYARRNFLPRA